MPKTVSHEAPHGKVRGLTPRCGMVGRPVAIHGITVEPHSPLQRWTRARDRARTRRQRCSAHAAAREPHRLGASMIHRAAPSPRRHRPPARRVQGGLPPERRLRARSTRSPAAAMRARDEEPIRLGQIHALERHRPAGYAAVSVTTMTDRDRAAAGSAGMTSERLGSKPGERRPVGRAGGRSRGDARNRPGARVVAAIGQRVVHAGGQDPWCGSQRQLPAASGSSLEQRARRPRRAPRWSGPCGTRTPTVVVFGPDTRPSAAPRRVERRPVTGERRCTVANRERRGGGESRPYR
jgi:hypothetical protein